MPLMRSPWKGTTCPCLLMAEQLYHGYIDFDAWGSESVYAYDQELVDMVVTKRIKERGGWCDYHFVFPVEPCEAIDVLLRTATYVLVVTFYEGG